MKNIICTLAAVATLTATAAPLYAAPPLIIVPGREMSQGQPTAGALRNAMQGKDRRDAAPKRLDFTINALGILSAIQLDNQTKLRDSAAWQQLGFLKTGQPLTAEMVQRATGLLDDLSGVRAKVVSERGEAPGTAVLRIALSPDTAPAGTVASDNYGGRYTGYGEYSFSYLVRNASQVGDELLLRLEITGDDFYNGQVRYTRPIGRDGLYLSAGYRQLNYALGEEFSFLEPNGMAKTYNLGIGYALRRTQQHNLRLGLTYEYTDLKDEYRADGIYFPGRRPIHYSTYNDKHSHAAILSLAGSDLDKRGQTSWLLAYKLGNLSFDSAMTERAFGLTNSAGNYSKLIAVFSRHQRFGPRLALDFLARGQYASRNLDSSERMALGGISGVRAYPLNEAPGDYCYFTRAELKWSLPLKAPGQSLQLATYLEHGGIQTSKDKWVEGRNHRHLQDIGLGVLWSAKDAWWLRADYAWKLGADKTQSDPRGDNGRFWIQGGIYF